MKQIRKEVQERGANADPHPSNECMQVREELQEHVRQSGFMLSDVIGLLLDAQDGASPAMDVMQFHAGMLIAC